MEPFCSSPTLLRARTHRGVTLIEMLIVLGIIGILSVIVVLSQRTFNRSILVNYTAYDIALTIRSAETFGLASRVTQQVSAQTGYGIHFDTSSLSSFVLFADSQPSSQVGGCHDSGGTPVSGSPDAIRGDCEYTSGSDERVNTYTLGNGMKILSPSGLCTYAGGAWDCSNSSIGIVFARPNTRVYFSRNGEYKPNITKARVIITSSQGGTYGYICIDQSGAIRVVSRATLVSNTCS